MQNLEPPRWQIKPLIVRPPRHQERSVRAFSSIARQGKVPAYIQGTSFLSEVIPCCLIENGGAGLSNAKGASKAW